MHTCAALRLTRFRKQRHTCHPSFFLHYTCVWLVQVKLAASAHPEGCVLVTDAISALGLGNGRHMLGDVEVNVSDDKATLAADGITLAGAVSKVRNTVEERRNCIEIFTLMTQNCGVLHSISKN